MAWEIPVLNITREAGEDLSAKQYHFVELNTTSGKVEVCDALTDIPLGVLQNDPADGEMAEIMVIGISKIVGDADLAIGDLIGPSADGQADARTIGTDTTHYVVGRVIEENTAAGGYVTATVNCLNPHRAA